MSCSAKECGYFCSCQGLFRGVIDFLKYKYHEFRNRKGAR